MKISKSVGQTCRSALKSGRRSSTALPGLRAAFTLVEVMVVMALLTFIVVALMGVFSSTQAAFRASLTQTDVLESGRAAMDLITGDVRTMAPSGGTNFGPVNFFAWSNSYAYTPLAQNLPASVSGARRVNLLNYFFVLGRDNNRWTGTGVTHGHFLSIKKA